MRPSAMAARQPTARASMTIAAWPPIRHPLRHPVPSREPLPRAARTGPPRADPGLARASCRSWSRRASGDPPAGLEALLGGLNPDQLRAVTHGEGPLLVVAGAGTGKTQVITRRIAWLIATRRARPSEILALTFTDKAADGDAGPRRPARPVRLHGHRDRARSTRSATGLIREYALELGLPTDVRVLTRAEVVIFLREHLFDFELDAYRPLGDPTRFLGGARDAVQPLQGRGHLAGRLPAHADRVAAEAAPAAAAAAAPGRTGRDAAEAPPRSAAAGRAGARLRDATRSCSPRTAASTSATRSRSRSGWSGPRRPPATAIAGPVPVHPRRRVPGHQPRPGRARRAARRAPSQRDRRRRRRPVDLRVPRRRDRQHPRLPRPLPGRADGRPAPQLPLAARRSSTRPTGSIRFNDPDRLEVRTGIVKRLAAERGHRRRAAPVRLEVFASGSRGGGLDRGRDRPPDRGRAPRRATTPSSSAPTATPTRSCARSTWPASRGGSPARPGCTPGRRSGCLLAFLRVVADLGSSVDLYAARRVASVYRPRRRGPDRDRQHGPPPQPVGLGGPRGARAPAGHPAGRRPRRAHRGRTARRGPARLRRGRPRATRPGEVLYRFLRGSGLLARLAATRHAGAEEQLRNVARFFEIVRAAVGAAGDDRAIFVAPPPRDADRGGRRSGHRRSRPGRGRGRGADRPQGEGPRVPGRLPARAGRRPLPDPADGRDAAGAAGRSRTRRRRRRPRCRSREERRLFYVAMTRARDELVLSHAADYGGVAGPARLAVRPRGARPAGRGRCARRRRADQHAGRARWPRFEVARPRPPSAADGPITEPLSLSFYQIDDYLTCPLKYKYAHVPARAARAAPRDRLRLRAPQGRPGVPSPPRPRPRHDRGGARRGVRVGLVERGVHEPRPRGGPAGGRSGGAPPVPRRRSSSPTP